MEKNAIGRWNEVKLKTVQDYQNDASTEEGIEINELLNQLKRQNEVATEPVTTEVVDTMPVINEDRRKYNVPAPRPYAERRFTSLCVNCQKPTRRNKYKARYLVNMCNACGDSMTREERQDLALKARAKTITETTHVMDGDKILFKPKVVHVGGFKFTNGHFTGKPTETIPPVHTTTQEAIQYVEYVHGLTAKNGKPYESVTLSFNDNPVSQREQKRVYDAIKARIHVNSLPVSAVKWKKTTLIVTFRK